MLAREGYTFSGWYNGSTKFDFSTKVTEDLNLVANWKANEYTVTWVTAKETINETYEYGTTPSFSGSTAKDADETYTYTFTGWDNEVTTVTGNTTYTAVFEETLRKYTVNFVVDGETITAKVSYGTVMTAPPLTKDGYTLNGWYTDTNGDVTLNFAAVSGSRNSRDRNRTITITEEEGTKIVSITVTGEGTNDGIIDVPGTDNPTVSSNSYTVDGKASGLFGREIAKVEGSYTYTTTITYYKYIEDSEGNRVYETDANGDKVLYTAEFTSIF